MLALPTLRPRPPKALARVALTLTALAWLAARPAAADALDDYLEAERRARRIPGLALAVARDGELLFERAYGLANVENRAPLVPGSIFAIASLDKQLTAAGVLRAAELGLLSLEDPVDRWVEIALPGATLAQLLSHTSGLPDQVAGSFEGRAFTDYTTDQLLATVAGLVPHAPPGHRFAYSDAGLFLAQLATERAAGEPWWDFMRREIFLPAGMATPVSLAPHALVPDRVGAYTLDASGALVRDRRLDVDYGPLYTDLGMTVADFARFLAALDRGRALSAASVERMTIPVTLAGGAPAGELFQWSRYGLGVGLDDFFGEPVVLHSGHSGVGFVRFPRRRLAVAVFTNLEHPAGSDPVGLALGVAGRLEPELSLGALAPRAPSDPALAARLRGDYEALLAGEPDLDRYAPPMRPLAWEGAGGLAGRQPRLGELERFDFLAEAPLDGARALLFRAGHAQATLYLRFSLDGEGYITRLVWWHV
jgi:CubicO group peptidase (beta-lactamase class C family)